MRYNVLTPLVPAPQGTSLRCREGGFFMGWPIGNQYAAGNTVQRTHGYTGTRTYKSWLKMRERCSNPKNNRFDKYGARGITVCERWQRFENFLADMGERPEGKSLDRINNDLGYSPENCRWATPHEQNLNRGPRTLRTHCRRGHELTPENLYVRPYARYCLVCIRMRPR